MSAGEFSTLAKYQASYDTAQIHPIRVQPETLLLALDKAPAPDLVNTVPAGASTSPISALIGLSRRERGLRARFVTLKWTGSPPTGYQAGTTFNVAIMQQSVFNSINIGDTGSYLETSVQVVAKEPERVR